MEAEISDLKAAVQRLTTENSQLIQEEEQRKAEIIDFKDNIQALDEQNIKLKSEYQKTVTVLSKAQKEVTHLKMACSENEKLHLTLQGKDDSLKQQETLILRLNGRIAEQEDELKQKEDHNVSLSGKVSELENLLGELRGQVDSLTSESSTLKNTVQEKERSSLEYQSQSSAAVENLSSNLQAKEAECESLKEQISHLEESVTKLSNTLRVQISEMEN
ncbi:hypothetical protein GBF38_006615, partial [Nibea albiflora]